MWKWSKAGGPYPAGFKSYRPGPEVWTRIIRDSMNLLMLPGAVLILVFALGFAVGSGIVSVACVLSLLVAALGVLAGCGKTHSGHG